MATPADTWTKPCAVLGGIFGAAQKRTKKASQWRLNLLILGLTLDLLVRFAV